MKKGKVIQFLLSDDFQVLKLLGIIALPNRKSANLKRRNLQIFRQPWGIFLGAELIVVGHFPKNMSGTQHCGETTKF